MATSTPLFSFGVIADVQHADHDSAWDFHKKYQRHYRPALSILKGAVESWNRREADPLAFVAQLGDLLDGKAKATNHESLDRLVELIDESVCKEWVHCIGNHELYCFERDELAERLRTRRDGHEYYSFAPHEGYRVVVLDPYEISLIRWAKEHPNYVEAVKLVTAHNPNDVFNYTADWAKGLVGLERRFMAYNGALGPEQLAWLRETLAAAAAMGEKVVVLSHVPMQPGATQDITLLWNYDEVLQELHRHPGVVVAVFNGHDHRGGYAVGETGIHHVVMPAVLECDEGQVAYGVVDVFPDRFELVGQGIVDSRTLPFQTHVAASG